MQLALLSNHDSRREARYKVLLRGRMRAGGLPAEVCVRDISSRGLLLQSAAPPRPGTIVEVLVAKRSIVGRLRWAKDRRFGIELSPPISVDALLAAAVNASSTPEGPSPRPIERQKPRNSESARRQAAQMQFAAFVILTAIAAVWMSSIVHEAATRSSETISAALRRSR